MSNDRREKRQRQAQVRVQLPPQPDLRPSLKVPAEMSRLVIELHRRYYERDGNPLHAWAAYQWARRAGTPLPLWVSRYLDSVATAMLDPAAGNVSAALAAAKALEVDNGQGQETPFQAFHGMGTTYAVLVQMLLDEGVGYDSALESVAADLDVAKNTVRKAFEKYRNICQDE